MYEQKTLHMQPTMTIYKKDGTTVPNIPATEYNKRQYEKILGSANISEFRMDTVVTAPATVSHTTEIKKETKIEVKPAIQFKETPITNESLIKHFTTAGKTPRAIATFLGLKVSDVETIINQ